MLFSVYTLDSLSDGFGKRYEFQKAFAIAGWPHALVIYNHLAHIPPVKTAASHGCGNVPWIKHSYSRYTLYFHSVLLVPRNMLCAQRSLPISFYLKYPTCAEE